MLIDYLLSPVGAPPKTVTYTLASLLMLCMGDSRNAAVVARAGAVPGLVSIARESSHRAANRELAAAMLAVMCRSQSAQVDVVASGGIPALTRYVCSLSPVSSHGIMMVVMLWAQKAL